MESEKVKEIKKALECCTSLKKSCRDCSYSEIGCYKLLKDTLTLINELESENERLSKELDSEWKDRRKAEEDLHKAQWNYKIGLAQSRKRNKELKDRIADLEKENAKLLDSVETVQSNRCVYKCVLTKEHLTKFAERLKEISCEAYLKEQLHRCIDETLKEFIK